MASKWESKEQNNLENARNFLLKGIHRHPEAEILYLDLFEIELQIAFQADDEEDKVSIFLLDFPRFHCPSISLSVSRLSQRPNIIVGMWLTSSN